MSGNAAPTDPAAVLASMGSFGSGNTKLGAIDLSNSTFNVQGFGIPSNLLPGGKTILTPDELVKVLHQTSLARPDVWAGIQYALYRSNYYNSMPDLGVFGSSDISGLKKFMENMTVMHDNPTNLQAASFLTQQENTAMKLGGNGVRTQIAKVTIPNTLDLNYIVDKAFRTALGRPPTAAESAKFASSYQGDVMAVARSNAATTAAAKTPAPAVPAPTPSVSTHPQTITPPEPAPGASIAENFASASRTPSVSVVGQQDVPQADVAALDFARKADPAAAASTGLNDAMHQWFSTLGKGGGQ